MGGDAPPRLLFVGPNLRKAVRELDVDPAAFHRWICAHELTHVFQFQGVPWLRGHLSGLVREYLSSVEVRIERGAAGGLPSLPNPSHLVDAFREGGLATLVQTREQRALMARMQVVMAVVEGYSEHVMDAIAPETIPGHAGLREAMDKRRRSRSAPARMIERLLGFEMKLRQYEQGKRFCDAVVAAAGMEALNRVWESPGALPTRGGARSAGELARAPGPAPRRRLKELSSGQTPSCNRSDAGVYVQVFDAIVLPRLQLTSLGDSPMAPQTETQRKATAQKAAATRRRNAAKRSQSARKAAETRAQAELNTLQAVQAQAERAVLIPVGAALVARDAVVEVVTPYTEGRESAERELNKLGKSVSTNLRKYERRGNTARNRTLREVKRTRTRLERVLRQRRTKAVRTVKQNRRDFEKQVQTARREVQGQAEGIVNRVASIA